MNDSEVMTSVGTNETQVMLRFVYTSGLKKGQVEDFFFPVDAAKDIGNNLLIKAKELEEKKKVVQ